MNRKKTIFENPFFNIAISLLCVVTALLLSWDNEPIYGSIAILPIGYILIYIFFVLITPKCVYHNIGYILYFALSLTKCVISPLFLYIGDYTSIFIGLNSKYILQAVALMIYEHLICSLVIAFSAKPRRIVFTRKNIKTNILQFNPAFIVMAMTAFMLALWFVIPEIQSNYVTIFEMFSSQEMFVGFDYTSIYDVGTMDRIFTTLFLVLFKSFRIILPFYVIKILREKFDNLMSFIVSIGIISLQFVFISETVATALVTAFILLSYMIKAYPKYERVTIAIMATSFVFVVFVLSLNFENITKWYGVKNVIEYISYALQSYVPGVCNTASVFRLKEVSGWITLRDTLISTIPFQSTLFGSILWENDLNTLFTSTKGLNAQIISTIAGGWYIFGFALAPAFSALFVRVSMVNGHRYQNTEKDLEKILYLYMCVQSMLGIGVYNIQITFAQWLQVGIVLWGIAKFSSRNKFKKNINS